jgi:hypothetical protein
MQLLMDLGEGFSVPIKPPSTNAWLPAATHSQTKTLHALISKHHVESRNGTGRAL